MCKLPDLPSPLRHLDFVPALCKRCNWEVGDRIKHLLPIRAVQLHERTEQLVFVDQFDFLLTHSFESPLLLFLLLSIKIR